MKRINLIFGVLISVMVQAQVPTNGLVGYWPFNGNVYDESYNGHNGTAESVQDTLNRFNIPNSAIYFNGSTSRILIPDTSSLDLVGGSITISGWVKPLSKHSTHYRAAIAGKGGWDINKGYELLIKGDLKIEWTIKRDVLTSDDTLLLNSYTHVVATFDNTNKISKIYFNGVERKSVTINSVIEDSNSPLTIGRRNDGNSYIASLHGFIDDVCIYNRALSATEINNLYLYQEKIHYTTVTVTDTLIINVNLLGFNPIKYNNVIKIYPNPTNDKINIDFGQEFNSLSNYKIIIINSLGHSIYESVITMQNVELNLNNWTGKGLYFIQLMKGAEIVDIKKIILQ